MRIALSMDYQVEFLRAHQKRFHELWDLSRVGEEVRVVYLGTLPENNSFLSPMFSSNKHPTYEENLKEVLSLLMDITPQYLNAWDQDTGKILWGCTPENPCCTPGCKNCGFFEAQGG